MVHQMKIECLVGQDRLCYRIYQERKDLRLQLGLRSLLSEPPNLLVHTSIVIQTISFCLGKSYCHL